MSRPKTGARFRFATTQSNVAAPTRSASWTVTVTVWDPALANESVPVIAPDGDPVTVTASGLPPGLSWHAATLTATGTPAPGSAGIYTVTLQASDGVALVPGVFQWTVRVPQCSNGIDDDADAAIDHPADPQCDSPTDDLERPAPACGLGFEVAFAVGGIMALRRRRAAKPKA